MFKENVDFHEQFLKVVKHLFHQSFFSEGSVNIEVCLDHGTKNIDGESRKGTSILYQGILVDLEIGIIKT